jgi:hypothetical protein
MSVEWINNAKRLGATAIWYKSDTLLRDVIGSHDGTFTNEARREAALWGHGDSVDFDGVDSYVSVSGSTDFDLTDGWSFETLFRRDEGSGSGTTGVIVAYGQSASNGYRIYATDTSTRVDARFVYSSTNYNGSSTSSSVVKGRIYHLVVTFSVSNGVTVYLDSEDISASGSGAAVENNTDLHFGIRGSSLASPLHGVLFPSAIYKNVELTASQVRENYSLLRR